MGIGYMSVVASLAIVELLLFCAWVAILFSLLRLRSAGQRSNGLIFVMALLTVVVGGLAMLFAAAAPFPVTILMLLVFIWLILLFTFLRLKRLDQSRTGMTMLLVIYPIIVAILFGIVTAFYF